MTEVIEMKSKINRPIGENSGFLLFKDIPSSNSYICWTIRSQWRHENVTTGVPRHNLRLTVTQYQNDVSKI